MASVPILEACRKMKRKPKLFNFRTFADPGCPLNLIAPFRDNVRLFLQHCAELEEYNLQGMPIWCTLLVHDNGSFVVPLYTIEENVEQSPRASCNQCRCSGWSNHLVSKRKYHFIITVDEDWNKPLREDVFDLQTHLLHGLVHGNGFGHLLCVNGIEGCSKFLCGREIMDLWDRLCTNLRTRKITVEDLSKKHSMDLRLLHGVAYRHSWFGRWGYRFCRGSFGVGEHHYSRALEILSSLELDRIVQDFMDAGTSGEEIKQIIRYYRDMSETQLVTMKDLLRFMLTVKSHAPAVQKKSITTNSPRPTRAAAILQKKGILRKEKSVRFKRFTSVITNMDSRWPKRRLEYAADIIVSALKETKGGDKFSHCGMTRQDVRDAARLHIGDTGLLDYVLKSLNNVIVGSHIIRRAVNPKTRILEYTINEVGNGVNFNEHEVEIPSESYPEPAQVAGVDAYSDVLFLYKNVLLDYPGSELVELATQRVLDSKHFVKEWMLNDEENHLLTFICRLIPSLNDREMELKRESLVGEIIVLPLHATVGDVKVAAEEALRDTYTVTEQIVVTDIREFEEMEDGEVIFGAVESGTKLCVRGTGINYDTPFKYEGGADNWKVMCDCGARDDDGERMVACDICEVWQHTRCCGIEDSENVPPLFVCSCCCGTLVPPRIKPGFDSDMYGEEYTC